MKTKEFLQLLKAHPEKELLFEYGAGRTVGANYHITEVKNITVDAVDCGAGTDFWKETVIQLWENPTEAGKSSYMTVYKAQAILDKVNRIKPMDREAPLLFEYGNPHFHTAQLSVEGATAVGKQLRVMLQPQNARCKASEICGIETTGVGASDAACVPGNGCC